MVFTRVQVLDFPQAHPGKCTLCGGQTNNDGRKYIDFGLSVPQYGAVIFCSHCFREINDHIGWISPEVASVIEADMIKAATKLSELEGENDRLRRALSELDFLSVDKPDESSDVVHAEVAELRQRYADLKSELDAERRAQAEDRAPKSTNVGRSKNVPDAKLDELLRNSL